MDRCWAMTRAYNEAALMNFANYTLAHKNFASFWPVPGEGGLSMTTFIALYRGNTIGNARLVAVSADPMLVAEFADRLLKRAKRQSDPVMGQLEGGKRAALRLIKRQAEEEAQDG